MENNLWAGFTVNIWQIKNNAIGTNVPFLLHMGLFLAQCYM